MPVGISELYDKVIQAGRIQDTMAISSFLNPVDEEQEDNVDQPTADDVLQEVIVTARMGCVKKEVQKRKQCLDPIDSAYRTRILS